MNTTRRDFLASTAATPAILASQGAPADRIRLAMIGAGGRGRDPFNEVRRANENA
ncbi:MAG: hypothetical protein HZB13_04690 [Acidobacteria bacterium]|nr:hypothetical protein [Acidobacteriota bacterium]